MEKVTITRIWRGEKETKFGLRPKIAIQTSQHGEQWLSTFRVKGTENWKEGDEVTIEVEQNGEYLNFTPVVPNFETRLTALESAVFGSKAEALSQNVDEPTDEPF